MRIIKDSKSLREFCHGERSKGNSIGFVPTMGALHEGHISLVRNAREQNKILVVSIFVNPLQFNQKEDYENYPSTLDADKEKLNKEGCDIVFLPIAEEFYSEAPGLSLDFGNLEKVMEGANRPGHFNGVGIVVAKFFNCVQPDKAYFGLKDLQQFLVIRTLERDLGFGIKVVGVPTVREASGLALSSRNLRLSEKGKKDALVLSNALNSFVRLLKEGKGIDVSLQSSRQIIKGSGAEYEYLDIGNIEDLSEVTQIRKGETYAICGAIWVDGIRLIDNLIFTGELETLELL